MMLWSQGKETYITDAVQHFEKKYGFRPSRIKIGKGCVIESLPEYITETKEINGAVQPYHIMLK